MTKADLEKYIGDAVFMAEDEIIPFCRLASTVSEGSIVEIGAGLGSSAVLLLCNSNIPVHSIDSFVGDSEGNWKSSEERCRRNVRRALQSLGKIEAMSRWNLYVVSSHDMSIRWQERIGLLYIDGNHQYGFVRQDFEDWISKVYSKGLIFLHDSMRNPNAVPGQFDRGWEGPTRLAQELQSDPRVSYLESFFSMTVWRKI